MRSPAGVQPPTGGFAEESGRRLAVLIDADNARAAVIEAVLEEVARFGEAIVRRIYGDFTSSQSASWKALLNKFSIKPMQQFAYTVGKNATDSTMIIDAMDLLYTRRFDGFCLVTSDSDFTGLAVRLREEGLLVYGFGEEKTPAAFRNACHKFLFTEVLRTASRQGDAGAEVGEARRPRDAEPPASAHPVIPADFLMEALDRSVDESGWTQLGTFGSYLQKIQPDFDTRLYGFRKLSDLVRGCPSLFVMEEREAPSGNRTIVYVRAREDD